MSEFAHVPPPDPDPDPDGLLLDEFLSLLPPLPTPIGVFSAGGVAEVVLADLDRGLPDRLRAADADAAPARRRVPAARPERRGLRHLPADREGLLPVVEPDAAASARHRHRAPARPPPHQAGAAQRRGRRWCCGGGGWPTASASGCGRRTSRGRSRVCDRAALAVGDRIMLSIWIGARPITMEALVMRAEPMSSGRSRIGCEVDAIAHHDREVVVQIAEAAESAADADGETRDDGRARPGPGRAARAQVAPRRAPLHALDD